MDGFHFLPWNYLPEQDSHGRGRFEHVKFLVSGFMKRAAFAGGSGLRCGRVQCKQEVQCTNLLWHNLTAFQSFLSFFIELTVQGLNESCKILNCICV